MPQEDTKQPLSDTASSGLTYEKAGVSIAAAEDAVARIKRLAESTRTPQVLAGVGPFAAAFQADFAQYEEPLLVASTDGVGTKVKLAAAFGRYKEVGRDTVAVSTNDVLTCGASPLFFLDYIACNRVEPNVIEELVTGMRDGCLEASMALVGGELAEMRDLYSPGEFDLVGFAVGVVDRSQLITGEQITVGDRLLAVPSSGIHANGLTLARKVFKGMSEEQWKQIDDRLGCSLADEMLKPTRIYAREMKHLLDAGLQIGVRPTSVAAVFRGISRAFCHPEWVRRSEDRCFRSYPFSTSSPSVVRWRRMRCGGPSTWESVWCLQYDLRMWNQRRKLLRRKASACLISARSYLATNA